jgi:hypothetical protein
MKKKEKKNSIETAVEVVNNLKVTEENSQKNEQEISTIKTLEASVRKIEKMKKEILLSKEKLMNKKAELNQEKELMWELVRAAKKIMKIKPEKKEKSEKKEKKQKVAKVTKPEETKK